MGIRTTFSHNYAYVLMTALAAPTVALAQTEITIPVLVPVTGFLSLEGTSQRNGALLAIKNAPPGLKVGQALAIPERLFEVEAVAWRAGS